MYFNPDLHSILRPWMAGSLALLGLLAMARGEGAVPRDVVPEGMEHWHHEYYSHSYVDPNAREGQEEQRQQPPASSSISKAGPHDGKSKPKVTIALGGHRFHHHRN